MSLYYYSDLAKKFNDLVKDGKNKSTSLKYKGKSDGVKLSTTLAYPSGKGNKAELEFTKPALEGLKSAKFEVSADEGAQQSATFKLDAPFFNSTSLKFSANEKSSSAELGLKYMHGKQVAISAKAKTDYSIKADAVFALAPGLTVGLPFKLNLGKGFDVAALKPAEVSARYAAGSATAAVKVGTEKFDIDANLFVDAAADFQAGVSFNSGSNRVGFAGKYKVDKTTTLAAQGASDGSFSYRLTHKLSNPGVTLGFSSAYSLKKSAGLPASLKSTAFGLDLTFE